MHLVFLLYALFAMVFTVAKYGLEYVQPFFLVGVRMLLAGGMLLSFLYFFDRKNFVFRWSSWKRFFLLGLTAIYLCNAFEFWGLQYLSSAKTCFIYSLSPFASALLSYWLLSERMSRLKWLGLLIGFIGFIPIFAMGGPQEAGVENAFLFFSWPELSVTLAAVAAVYGWIVLRQLVRDEGYSPLMANGVSMVIGGALSLTHSFFTENWDPVPVTEYKPFLESMALQIIISNILAYNLYGYLLKHFSAPFMSFAGFSTPFFTVAISWLTLGETVGWGFWISSMVVLAGLGMFYVEELREQGVHKEEEVQPQTQEALGTT